MTRTFTEILTLMQRGAGRFASEEALDAFKRRALFVEMADSAGHIVRRPAQGDDCRIVFLRPPEASIKGLDGSIACNTLMRFPNFGNTLVLSVGSEECHPFWFGLKVYAEWVRHLEYARGHGRGAKRVYGELVARVLDFEFDRALACHAPRRADGPPDRRSVIVLEECVNNEISKRFPDAASDVEMLTRRSLTDVAVHFAARGALGMAGVA